MSLVSMWKESQEQILSKKCHQLIRFAGDGKLRDGSDASIEFRELLSMVPSNCLSEYAQECLTAKFEESGFVLQDVINEVGRRLGFTVESGLYQGKKGSLGFDGFWLAGDGSSITVEVKTTDAYRMDLNVFAGYRDGLIRDGRASSDQCSILIVVGRSDTGDLEAQIRGSKNAWDMRLVSVDALLRLLKVREELDDPAIFERIRETLKPQEFTKVDGIIDLVFSTAKDAKKDTELFVSDEEEPKPKKKSKTVQVSFREECITRLETYFNTTLIKRTNSMYASPDNGIGICCAISREYTKGETTGYWFAFHPYQDVGLSGYEQAFVALGCGSASNLLLIPFREFKANLAKCNRTEREDRFYWHIVIAEEGSTLSWKLKKGFPSPDLSQNRI